MYIGFDSKMPGAFTLEVDGARFDSEDATYTSYTYAKIYQWDDAQIEWSDGQEVELRIYQDGSDTQ